MYEYHDLRHSVTQDGVIKTISFDGSPGLAEISEMLEIIKRESISSLYLILDFSEIVKFPPTGRALLSDLFKRLHHRNQRMAFVGFLDDEIDSKWNFVLERQYPSVSAARDAMFGNMLRGLIIEDEECTQTLLKSLFRKLRIDVTMAESAEKGIEELKSQRIDFVIADIHLPGIDGIEFAQRLCGQEVRSRIPIFMLTSDQNRETVARSVKAKVHGYLLKPLDERTVIDRVVPVLKATMQ